MLQFIPKGPQIPENVIQDLNNDSLVLFCGAGISMNNGLPSSKDLVKKVCKKLHITIDNEPLLKEAIDNEPLLKEVKDNEPLLKEATDRSNYDGILDLIEGNQPFSVKPSILRKKIIDILSEHNTNAVIHKSLLELSALSNNKGHRLVTTNFDKLFFEAKQGLTYDSAPKLAPPRKETLTER